MTKIKNILLDFDGTIADSSIGVYKSVDKVVDYYNLDIQKGNYPGLIGPPLRESFSKILGLPPEEIKNAIKVYREYYSEKGMYECRVYDGIENLVKDLKSLGMKVYVATSKPEFYARKILEKLNIADLFDYIAGGDIEESTRIEKVDVLKYLIEEEKLNVEECLMVGDRIYDVEGAHEVNIKCCGILWGFGNEKEFLDCGADYICKTPEDVKQLVEKL
jgi:phosphoglycolate phosphatase